MTARVVTLGETMALVTANGFGPLATSSTAMIGIGGAETNVAIGLRRLGVPVTWLGRVGADPFGERIVRTLRAEDIDTVAIVDSSAPTGLMIKERRNADSTRVWYYRQHSAGSALRPEDLEQLRIPDAQVLHLTGITPGLSSTACATVTAAIHSARMAGVLVSLDVNYRARVWGERSFREVLLPLIGLADVVFGGVDELRLLVDAPGPPQIGSALARLGPTQVIVKLGEHGCWGLVDGAEYVCAALPVTVADTVGAGDAFVAGYLAELIQGAPPQSRLRLASAVAAAVCGSDGDWEGLPTRAELSEHVSSDPVLR